MLSGVWNSIAGYVIIEVKGKGLERFINLAVHNGVEIWNVRRTGASTVTARVSVGGFYALRKLVRGQSVRIAILEKRGLIMRFSRLRFRKVLLYGWAVVLAVLIMASRRIWFIEIEGCDTVPEEAVLFVLDELGVRIGAPRNIAPTFGLGSKIMASDARIAWAGAQLDGVTLRISLREAEPAPELLSEQDATPASIYAAKDGVIRSITVYDGKANVHVGDAVLAGQELITGVLRSDESHTLLTRARGEVTAAVLYRFSATAGPTILKPVRTGEAQEYVRLSLFGLTLDSKRDGAASSGVEEESLSVRTLLNCFLPLKIERFACYPLEERAVTATAEELKEAALAQAHRAMESAIPKDARILSKQSETTVLADGTVQATIFITTEETIGETRGIDGRQQNGLDENGTP